MQTSNKYCTCWNNTKGNAYGGARCLFGLISAPCSVGLRFDTRLISKYLDAQFREFLWLRNLELGPRNSQNSSSLLFMVGTLKSTWDAIISREYKPLSYLTKAMDWLIGWHKVKRTSSGYLGNYEGTKHYKPIRIGYQKMSNKMYLFIVKIIMCAEKKKKKYILKQKNKILFLWYKLSKIQMWNS